MKEQDKAAKLLAIADLKTLMKKMKVGDGMYDPIPPKQITALFRSPAYPPVVRVLAWVRYRTLCYENYSKRSHYCVDERGRRLGRQDCADDLKLDKSVAWRQFEFLARRGAIRFEDGKIFLCGDVPEVPEVEAQGEAARLPRSLLASLENLDTETAEGLKALALELKTRCLSESAAAVRDARRRLAQSWDQLLMPYGISQDKGRWAVVVQQPNSPATGPGTADARPAAVVVQEPNPSATGPEAAGAPPPSPVAVQQLPSGTAHRNLDDIRSELFQSSKDTLVAVMERCFGRRPDVEELRKVSDRVEVAGKTLDQFIDYILAPDGTGTCRVERSTKTPGPGWFDKLARKFGSELSKSVPAPVQAVPHPADCRGGILSNGAYCVCQTGQDMKRRADWDLAKKDKAKASSAHP